MIYFFLTVFIYVHLDNETNSAINFQNLLLDGKYLLKNIELSQKSKTSRRPTPSIDDIRKDVIDSLTAFSTIRSQIPNRDLLNTVEKFLKLDNTADITEIHISFGKDLELSFLVLD